MSDKTGRTITLCTYIDNNSVPNYLVVCAMICICIGQNIKPRKRPSVRPSILPSDRPSVRRLWTKMRRNSWTNSHQSWNIQELDCVGSSCTKIGPRQSTLITPLYYLASYLLISFYVLFSVHRSNWSKYADNNLMSGGSVGLLYSLRRLRLFLRLGLFALRQQYRSVA